MQQIKFSTARIADAGTVSNAIDASDSVLAAVHIPTGFDGTTLALQASTAMNGTFRAVHSAGSAWSLVVAANTVAVIPPDVSRGLRCFKVVVAAQTGAIDLECALVAAEAS